MVTPTSVPVNSSLSRLDSTDVRLRSRLTYNRSKNARISQCQFTSTSRASSKQFSRMAHVKRGSYSRSLSLAPAQTGWREVVTQIQYGLSADQLDRCDATGATLRATSRETSTGTGKQTRTRTQTNQLKGQTGVSGRRLGNPATTPSTEILDFKTGFLGDRL